MKKIFENEQQCTVCGTLFIGEAGRCAYCIEHKLTTLKKNDADAVYLQTQERERIKDIIREVLAEENSKNESKKDNKK